MKKRKTRRPCLKRLLSVMASFSNTYSHILEHVTMYGCTSDIRGSFFGPKWNLGLKPGLMGAHCLHPLVAGCNSTTYPFVCLRVFTCAQCVCVRLCVNLESAKEHASSGESTILYVCVGRPPSISCIS